MSTIFQCHLGRRDGRFQIRHDDGPAESCGRVTQYVGARLAVAKMMMKVIGQRESDARAGWDGVGVDCCGCCLSCHDVRVAV